MPFPMKIQPLESKELDEQTQFEPEKPVVKWRLKRLFERQFQNVLRNSPAEKAGAAEDIHLVKDASNDIEPSSVCLAKMVQSFMEDSNERQQSGAVRYNRNRCNCFNANGSETSNDEFDFFSSFGSGDSGKASSTDQCEVLKNLVLCASVEERNLLADTSRIVEKNKSCKRKDEIGRKIIKEELLVLGYDASICKSRWEKSPSHPAGEYEYIDVLIEGERLIVDIDFRSEFEIARSTKAYKSILQTLPFIFVGKSDRLEKIIATVSEAAKQSLKKKGMHIPPWRKVEYVKAKWLTPCAARCSPATPVPKVPELDPEQKKEEASGGSSHNNKELKSQDDQSEGDDYVFVLSESSGEEEENNKKPAEELKPAATKNKSLQIPKVLSGFASMVGNDA